MTIRDTVSAPTKLIQQLEAIFPKERIKSRLIDIISYAPDAGFYHLVPKAVVLPESEEEIRALFQFSRAHRIPLCFRAGGTSLSGQAVTDGILVDISRYWRRISIEAEGQKVRVQPGVIGSHVNAQLKKFRRKIGPDPASINSAMIGGIISNNASGMCCGVTQNSYHTIRHLRFMLPSGQVYSTELPEDYNRFDRECPQLAESLLRLKNQIEQKPELYQLIRKKYRIKNTVGYAINALVDYDKPLDIFAHLLVGAEGTLGFIAEAVMDTVPDYPFKSTSLLFFHDIFAACAAIHPFATAGAKAIELMDRASLRSVEHIKGVPAIIKQLPTNAAALLIEFQANHPDEINEMLGQVDKILSTLSLLEIPVFSTDPHIQALYWKVRKGMFPSVGAVRARGTTVILEDVAVPVENLGNAISDLQVLFAKYLYDNAIIFGHAKDGNIHFVVTQAFETAEEIKRYDHFIKEVVELIANKYGGSLKAEHGTGRNMAPFVETEWGPELYAMMRDLKSLADPDNLLNPGVIINSDSEAHIRHLKKLPQVEEEVDTCIECGFCEHKCPSRDITLTPRRRIIVRRALQTFDKSSQTKSYKELLRQYQYDGLDTCAVDGLCATACPVDIDTGKLVKRLRKENHSRWGNAFASFIARNFGSTATLVKRGLGFGVFLNKLFGKNAMRYITKTVRKLLPGFPLWSNQLFPAPGIRRIQRSHAVKEAAEVVYYPTCISRVMGDGVPAHHVIRVFSSVAQKAGVHVYIPNDIKGTCCGQIFSSKGFAGAYASKANEMVEKIWQWTDAGKLPLVMDFTSCVYTSLQSGHALTLENQQRLGMVRIIDSLQFLQEFVIPRSVSIRKKKSIVLHPVCSLEKMGIQQDLADVAAAFAEQVLIPQEAGCCGMAGDRGFLFPELTAAACAPEANEVKSKEFDGYYSTSKTCEIALSEAVGKDYQSLMLLADECLPVVDMKKV